MSYGKSGSGKNEYEQHPRVTGPAKRLKHGKSGKTKDYESQLSEKLQT